MSRIADLMLRQGEIRADKARTRGDLYSGIAQTVGAIPMTIGAMRAAQATAAQDAQDRDLDREYKQTQIRSNADANTRENAKAIDEAEARALAQRTERVNGWLTTVASANGPDEQMARYKEGRDQLVADGTLTEQDAPAFFPGQSWVKSRMMQTLNAADRFRQLFPEPEKPKLVPVTSTQDGVQTTTMQPEAAGLVTNSAPVAPPRLTLEQQYAEASARGDRATADRILDDMRRQAGATRAPATGPVGEGYKLVNPQTGEQRIVRGDTAANALLGQGWKQYDAVASRSDGKDDDLRATQYQRATDGIAIIDALISFNPDGTVQSTSGGLDRAFGSIQGALPDVFQGTVDAAAAIDRLLALVTLPEMQSLRGLGPASDRDVSIVQSGASTLKNRRLGDDAVRDELKRIRDAFVRLQQTARAAGVQMVPAPSHAAPLNPTPSHAAPAQRVNPFRR